MSRTRRFLLAAVAVLAMASVLAYLNRIPAGWFRGPWDKAGHMVLYGWLAAAIACALPRRWRRFALWGPLLLGVVDELAQTLSPNRSADPWDFLADAVGIAVASALVRLSANLGGAHHGTGETEGA